MHSLEVVLRRYILPAIHINRQLFDINATWNCWYGHVGGWRWRLLFPADVVLQILLRLVLQLVLDLVLDFIDNALRGG